MFQKIGFGRPFPFPAPFLRAHARSRKLVHETRVTRLTLCVIHAITLLFIPAGAHERRRREGACNFALRAGAKFSLRPYLETKTPIIKCSDVTAAAFIQNVIRPFFIQAVPVRSSSVRIQLRG